jgi:hypothetical protein
VCNIHVLSEILILSSHLSNAVFCHFSGLLFTKPMMLSRLPQMFMELLPPEAGLDLCILLSRLILRPTSSGELDMLLEFNMEDVKKCNSNDQA